MKNLIEQKAQLRSGMIETSNAKNKLLSLLENQKTISSDDKTEIKKLKGEVKQLNEAIEGIDNEIQQLTVEYEKANHALIIENRVKTIVEGVGVPSTNWQLFIDGYNQAVKVFKSEKITFDALSDETLTESSDNATKISNWFSRLEFNQKTCDESIFELSNKLTGLRLKTENLKKLISENHQLIIDNLYSIDDCKLVLEYLFTGKQAKPASTTGERKPRSGSVKAQVENYLCEIGEGEHSLSDYESFFHSVSTGTTKPVDQLRMNTRLDKPGNFTSSIDVKGDTFTLTAR